MNEIEWIVGLREGIIHTQLQDQSNKSFINVQFYSFSEL